MSLALCPVQGVELESESYFVPGVMESGVLNFLTLELE